MRRKPIPTPPARSLVTSARTIRIGTLAAAARLRARATALATSSTPVTSQPRWARLTPHTPLPEPTSSARPKGYLVDWTHLFGDDKQRFPYHQYAIGQPAPKPVESYSVFVREAKIDHCIIVHSIPSA